MSRFVARNGWVLGLITLLVALLVLTRLIQPSFGATGLQALAGASLPFAFATAGMAIVIIVGGIDLSIASMMAVASVVGATLMDGATGAGSAAAVVAVLALGVGMGALNGALIVLTRVPDIVVTLAMLFVWEGVALLVLNAPGGDAADWLRALGSGGLVTDWVPAALVLLLACVVIVWVPVLRSRTGLAIYATGSDERAAFRSGVNIDRTKVIAYALAGLFAAMGGLSLTMLTGIGEPIPGPYLLASVAAAVLGGVVLGGGKGGLLGPLIAVFVLRTVRLDLTLLRVDPNVSAIIEGVIMVSVVMLGGLLAIREERR